MKTFFEINSDEFVNEAISVIKGLGTPFNSHQFIQKFAEKNEAIYVKWLYNAIDCKKGAFWKVHSEIGSRLLDYSTQGVLPIRKNGDVKDVNVFGNPDNIALWEKTE